MDEKTSIDLRRALDLLKKGDAKSAQPILVRILKENPDIEQAWYMLSFVVSEFPKQRYALEQALRINPQNQKAMERLAKLSGALEAPADDTSAKASEPQPQVSSMKPRKPTGDLLSQRMGTFGIPAEIEQGESRSKSTSVGVAASPKKKEKKPRREKKARKQKSTRQALPSDPFAYVEPAAKRPRSRIVLLIVAILTLMILVLAYSASAGLFGDILGGLDSDPAGAPSIQTPTSTETPDEGGRRLPPTWTPTGTDTPTITPTPTLTPTETEIPTS